MYILPQSQQWRIQYHVMLYHVLTAPGRISVFIPIYKRTHAYLSYFELNDHLFIWSYKFLWKIFETCPQGLVVEWEKDTSWRWFETPWHALMWCHGKNKGQEIHWPTKNRWLGAKPLPESTTKLQWHHNGCDGVSNHQSHDCLLNRFIQAQIKENIKAPHHWPLWGEFTDDRWIPHTKGQ